MSKRPSTSDVFQTKVTRNDRFAQMSHQEKVIEQKKKEIQARLDVKQKPCSNSNTNSEDKSVGSSITTSSDTSKQNNSKSSFAKKKLVIKSFNQFSNDGSFLDQFKQIKGRKLDQKLKSFRYSHDRSLSDDRNKSSRWSHRRRSPSPKIKMTRFSDKLILNEPKISISTCYSNLISQANFSAQPQLIQPQITITTQNVVGQPLMKDDSIAPPIPPVITFSTSAVQTTSVISASPVILSLPPPLVLQQPLVAPQPESITTTILTSVPNAPPPNIITSLIPPPVQISTCAPALELATIPPPNAMQIQNIPQPEPLNTHNIPPPAPLNTHNIPPPAPLQVQNIPPPSPIHLNEIPNPKPLDVMNIPTPDSTIVMDTTMSDPDFLKNIPPPNKSVPPPSLQDTAINVNIAIPPPNTIHLPPQTQTISVQNIIPTQNILVHSVPSLPPSQLISTQNLMAPAVQNVTLVSQVQTIAPPPPPPQATLMPMSTISVALTVQNQPTVGVISPASTNVIPSLLAQPVLPPSGMSVTLPVNIHCPPPSVSVVPPSYINQPPPITTQLPPVNVPPPISSICTLPIGGISSFRDFNAGLLVMVCEVCPPGTPEYEAMASLGRMVAQCGPGIEDIVRQRKPEDPNLWFLFHKESAAYQHYLHLVEEFKNEAYKPEDIYDPEKAMDDYNGSQLKQDCDDDSYYSDNNCRRKRRSRWGGKDLTVPPPTVVMATVAPVVQPINSSPSHHIMLSQITRNDPALIQYALVTYGTTNLSEEDWKKAEDNYKILLVYKDMLRKKEEAARLASSGKNKYEYDSDEEVGGGTWEHKLREKEMADTVNWANDLTQNAEGKHHIGDFLPPDEFQRFMESNTALKEGRQPEFSDYKEFKIREDNVGFKMLQKLGWTEGQGLGAAASGIVEPVNKAALRDHSQGLGLLNPGSIDVTDDEYDSYRKRMMLAYRFRPNPLNNPRRPYY